MILNQNQIYDKFLRDTDVGRLQKSLQDMNFQKNHRYPREICECGVFKGSGIFTWVKLMMLFKPNNKFNVVGFDLFDTKRKKLKFKYKIDKKVQAWHSSRTIQEKEIFKRCDSWGFKNIKDFCW